MLNISLQKKTLGVIGLTLVALIVALYVASQVIVMGSFSEQESQETQQNVERVKSAIDDNLQSLVGTARDWSIWDDTYYYVQGTNQSYFEKNLAGNASMQSNQLNLMLFVSSDGRIRLSKGYDYHTNKVTKMPEGLRKHIYPGSWLLVHNDISKGKSGILSLAEGPMLIDVEPILTSDGEGPVAGTLIFGRYLDEEAISHLAKTTALKVSLHDVKDINNSVDFQEIRPSLSEGAPATLKTIDSSTIAGFKLLPDIYGQPALVLRIDMPRAIYARGQQTLQYFVIALLVSGLVFGLMVAILLEKLVLSRVARLKEDVGSIEATSDMAGRVALSGNDELADLAGSINSMLTALQRSREDQREGEERYKALVEQITEAIFLVDAETGQFLEANLATQTLLGYERDELLELSLEDVAQPDLERRTGALNRLRTTGSLRIGSERNYVRKNGTVVTLEVSDSNITYGGREALCVVARDITDRKRAEAALRDLAMRDGLTGLYNRREMQRILREQIERYAHYEIPSALIMLDIDHFKSVNDTYGHQVGDDVLRWMARLVPEMVRADDRVARYGGEELAVILPDLSSEAAFEIAERLRKAIAARPFEFIQVAATKAEQVLIPITISVGVASVPDDAVTLTGIIECADKALYEAKHRGRNRTVEYAGMRPDAHLRIVR